MADPLCGTCGVLINGRTKTIRCSGFCNRLFHTACQGIPSDVSKFLEKVNGLTWSCDLCTDKLQEINKIVDGRMKVLFEEIQKSFSYLHKEILEAANKKICEIKISASDNSKLYSTVTKGESAVIVQPKNADQTCITTKTDIYHNINPINSEIKVSGVKTIRNGGLLIGCSSDEDANKFKQLVSAKLSDKYELKEPNNFNPRVRIVGMADKLDSNEIVQLIQVQNRELIGGKFNCKVLEITSLKKRTDIYQAIVQFDVETYNNIVSRGNGKLFIGYDVCSVYDAIDIKRCYNCSGFSHFSKECSAGVIHCPKCSGDHLVKNCNCATLKCINCIKSNNAKNTEFDVSHAAWDRNCPVYIQKINEFKSNMFLTK